MNSRNQEEEEEQRRDQDPRGLHAHHQPYETIFLFFSSFSFCQSLIITKSRHILPTSSNSVYTLEQKSRANPLLPGLGFLSLPIAAPLFFSKLQQSRAAFIQRRFSSINYESYVYFVMYDLYSHCTPSISEQFGNVSLKM